MDNYLKVLKFINFIIEKGEIIRHDHENKVWQWKDLYVIESTKHQRRFLVNSSNLNVSIPITLVEFNAGSTEQFNKEYQRAEESEEINGSKLQKSTIDLS